MPVPLLLTKLNVPPLRFQRVVRSTLVEQMNAGITGKLNLVCAPAGYGKTTLALDWLSQLSDEFSCGWISLDEGDNDPVRFLAYIIAAIQQRYEHFGEKTRPCCTHPKRPQVK